MAIIILVENVKSVKRDVENVNIKIHAKNIIHVLKLIIEHLKENA